MNTVSTPHTKTDRILPLQRRETILVVDDHPDLCEVAKIFLTHCGYHVLTAQDPGQAKRAMRQNPEIDLLLTDVEMPGMFGDELAEWFRGVNPRAAVVFMSGNPIHRLRLEGHPFVGKPFVHLDVLAKTIRETLAQKSITTQSTAAVAA